MALTNPPERPVRVLFHNSYPGLNGSQKMALQLLQNLPDKNFEVWAGGPFATEFLEASGLPPERRLDFGLPPAFRTFRGGLLQRRTARLAWQVLSQLLPFWWRAGRQLRRTGIEVVYVSNERCLFFIGLPARLAGLPVLWHLQSGFSKGRPGLHWLASWLATAVVAVSEAVRADARGFLRNGLWRRMRVIYNGLPDLPVVRRASRAVRLSLAFVGALTPEKGLHVLIDALASLPENLQKGLTLLVAGTFREAWYRNWVERQTTTLPASISIEWLGYCADVPGLLARTDLLIVPSVETETFRLPDGSQRTAVWKEGFNLVALEGLRANVPVLNAATYGLREVVVDGESGCWFRTGDAVDLANKIERLAGDARLREELARAGRARYERYFTSTKMQMEFHQLFNTLAGRHG